MKRILLILACIFMIINLYPQGKVFFDVKTKMAEKTRLTHIKTATVLLLLKTEWASVSDISPEYALWLRNYKITESVDEFKVTLEIEIRKPAFLREGDLYISKYIEVEGSLHQDVGRSNSHFELIRKALKNSSDKVLTEATLVSERIVEEVYYMLQGIQ